MVKLVRFVNAGQTNNGAPVYINPETVAAVFTSNSSDPVSVLFAGTNLPLKVQGLIDEIVDALQHNVVEEEP